MLSFCFHGKQRYVRTLKSCPAATNVSSINKLEIQEQSVRSCAENMIEMLDMDEDPFDDLSSSDADSSFSVAISCIQDIIMDEDFQHLQQSFMMKHYLEFDDSDENKLSYTTIFNEYVDLLEKHLEQQLTERIPVFNMNAFIELVVLNKEEVPDEIYEMLLTFTDFVAFKEMFLEYRAEKEGRGLDLSPAIVVTPLTFGHDRVIDSE